MEARYPLSAHYIQHSLNLGKLEKRNPDLTLWRKERNVLVYKLSETQLICVYSFGVVTTFGIEDKRERDKYLRKFAKAGETEEGVSLGPTIYDEYPVIIDPSQPESVEFDVIRLTSLSIENLLLVFHVLAQSVAIDFLEQQVEGTVHRFERVHLNLSRFGKITTTTKDVMKTIGLSGNTVSFIVGHLALLDKPAIVWEDKDAETLYINLRKMYELEDRFHALQFKLQFIQDSSELMLDVLQNRHSNFLELIIIALFVFDIILYFVVG